MVSAVYQVTCGVSTTLSSASSGLSGATGSVANTSRHRRGQLTAAQRGDQRGLVDDRPAAGVDQHRTRFHPGQRVVRRTEVAGLEGVALGAAGDQGVQAVLRPEGIGGVAPAAGEGSDAPLVGVRAVRGVPGLMGSMKVADAEVNHPNRGSGGRVRQRTG